MTVSRFGVSLEKELLDALDKYAKDNSFSNRSQAIRFLIEKNLVEEKWMCDNIVAGAVTLVYPADKEDIRSRLQEIQRENKKYILSSQLFYMEDKCLEIVAVKGPSFRLTELSDKLISVKGIQHGKLIMSKVN